jgi:hypothetical protein
MSLSFYFLSFSIYIMDFKRVSIKRPSDRIISRLRNGHQVRMMKGEGLDIMLKPAKLIKMAKKFMTGKGIQISLDPEEVSANRQIEGEGIFGKKFDKTLKKAGIKKAVYAIGSAAKPLVQQGIQAAEQMAIAYGVPPSIASKIGDTATQYVDDPKSLQGKKGLQELKKRGLSLGQELADMGTAEMGMDSIDVADLVKKATAKKDPNAPKTDYKTMGASMVANSLADRLRERFSEPSTGQGLYAGRGLGMGFRRSETAIAPMAGMGLFGRARRAERSIMGRGALIGGEISPALMSQPYAANYQFGATLGPYLRR